MYKNVWLITHDSYIDRRIFFFADVFKSRGYKVKLFPYFYFDLSSDMDPDYVLRPVSQKCVKEYDVDIEELLLEEIEAIKEIRENQKKYFERNQKYANSVKKLKIKSNFKKKIKFHIISNNYFVYIQRKEYYIIFNSFSDTIKKTQSKYNLELIDYENVLYKYKMDYQDSAQNVFNIDEINLKEEYKDLKNDRITMHRPNTDSMYIYEDRYDRMIRIQPLIGDSTGNDILCNKEFNYKEYKGVIYNYSCIIEKVKNALEFEKPDMIYVADLPTLPIGVMLKEVLRCPLIIDCHEWWYKQTELWEGHFKRKIELSKEYERLLYEKCDVCITVGKYLAQDMEKEYNRKFETIYSCMNEELSMKEVTYDNELWNRLFEIPKDSHIAIFQGGMTSFRNLDNLARATKYLEEDSYLVIVGGGTYEEEFKMIVNKEGNMNQVKFVGWVNQSELLKFTINAHLGILPYTPMNDYYSYAVPNKLMEYFEAMLPILYDEKMKEISMVAGENDVGIGEDLSDYKKLGIKMNELLHDKEKLEILKSNYDKCKDIFNFKNQKKEFERILDAYHL